MKEPRAKRPRRQKEKPILICKCESFVNKEYPKRMHSVINYTKDRNQIKMRHDGQRETNSFSK